MVLDNANDQADITGTSQDIPTGGTVDLVLPMSMATPLKLTMWP
ncbi:hypothetical protein [Shewanella sp. MEBiC00475]|nr:hypothetical protein [Shewanella sp. MEBiC00475]